jgi:hypothetical protein
LHLETLNSDARPREEKPHTQFATDEQIRLANVLCKVSTFATGNVTEREKTTTAVYQEVRPWGDRYTAHTWLAGSKDD